MYFCMFICLYNYLFVFPHPREQSFRSQMQPVYKAIYSLYHCFHLTALSQLCVNHPIAIYIAYAETHTKNYTYRLNLLAGEL